MHVLWTHQTRAHGTMLTTNRSVSIAKSDGEGLPARVLVGCVLFLLTCWTFFGNFTVCAAVLRFRHLRAKVTNTFIASLAVSDLLVAVLVMPWKAVAEVAGHWPFGTFCDTWVAFDIMCSTASILNLCGISLDRYWAISSPFRYERSMTKRMAFIMVSVTWTVSLVISFVPVQLNWHRELGTSADGNVTTPEKCDSSLSRTYAISSSLISFFIPVAIMLATYSQIYHIARMQIQKISSLERAAQHAQSCREDDLPCPHHRALRLSLTKETKLLKTLSVIMGVFVCCWLPFFVLNCAVPFCQDPRADGIVCVSETTFDVFVWFGWSNSSLNPIIYAFNTDFRDAFTRLLGCHCVLHGSAGTRSNDQASNNQGTSVTTSMGVGYVSIPHDVEGMDEEEPSRSEGPEHHRSDSVTEPLCASDDCEGD